MTLRNKQIFRAAAVVTLAMGALLLALILSFPMGSGIWEGLFTEQETLFFFCEPPQVSALIRQPVDTFTNLGFLFVGAVLVGYGLHDRKHPQPDRFVTGFPVWSILLGVICLFTFLCSSFFHASLTRFGEYIDLVAVYGGAILPLCFNLQRIVAFFSKKGRNVLPFLLLLLVLWLGSNALIFRARSSFVVLGLVSCTAITSAYIQSRLRTRAGLIWLLLSVTTAILATSFFFFDINRILCMPESLFQPHGVWHLMAAASTGTFYGYMRNT